MRSLSALPEACSTIDSTDRAALAARDSPEGGALFDDDVQIAAAIDAVLHERPVTASPEPAMPAHATVAASREVSPAARMQELPPPVSEAASGSGSGSGSSPLSVEARDVESIVTPSHDDSEQKTAQSGDPLLTDLN